MILTLKWVLLKQDLLTFLLIPKGMLMMFLVICMYEIAVSVVAEMVMEMLRFGHEVEVKSPEEVEEGGSPFHGYLYLLVGFPH